MSEMIAERPWGNTDTSSPQKHTRAVGESYGSFQRSVRQVCITGLMEECGPASATGQCPGLWDDGHLGSATLRYWTKYPLLLGCCPVSAQEVGFGITETSCSYMTVWLWALRKIAVAWCFPWQIKQSQNTQSCWEIPDTALQGGSLHTGREGLVWRRWGGRCFLLVCRHSFCKSALSNAGDLVLNTLPD